MNTTKKYAAWYALAFTMGVVFNLGVSFAIVHQSTHIGDSAWWLSMVIGVMTALGLFFAYWKLFEDDDDYWVDDEIREYIKRVMGK